MRIIDADALDWAFTSLRWRDGELLHWGDRPNWCLVGEEVEKLIADAPTIDAIPVEWLKAHKLQYLEDWGVVPVAVGQALTMWQKEREKE